MRDQEILDLYEAYKQVCEAETARGPRLIDAYDKPPYSDDAAAAKNPVKMKRKGPKMTGVVRNEELENVDEEKRPFPFKKVAAQQEKARKGSVYGKPATNEPAPQVSDKEKSETRRFSKMHQVSQKAKREKQEKDKASRSSTFYKDTHPASAPKMKKANEEIEVDIFDIILEHLVAEGYADTNEAALAIMANMSEEWKQDIMEAAADQSDKQIEKGVKTTYKAQNVLDNQHQGRSRGLNRLPANERKDKSKRMGDRLKSRRDDLFQERGKREDEKREKLKKMLGL